MRKAFLPFLFLVVISAPFFVSAQSDEPTDGTLLRAEGDSKVYIVNAHGFRRHIPSPEAFNSYGFDWDAVKDVPQEEVESFPETTLIRVAGSIEVYRVVGKERQWVKNPTIFEESGFDWNAVIVVTPDDAGHFNRGTDITEPIATTPAIPAGSTEQPAGPVTPDQPATSTESMATSTTPIVPTNSTTSTEPIATPASAPTPAPTPTTPTDSTPTADTTAPVISNIQATNITEKFATITWITDELSDGKVRYAITSPISLASTTDIIGASITTSHTINLENLSANETYYYLVVSADPSSNTATSSEYSFNTLEFCPTILCF